MTPLVPLTLFGWFPLILFLFRWLPARRAVIIALIGGFLFLPQHTYALPIIPDYDRLTATCYGIVVGTLLFDIDRLRELKLGWIDLPMLIWCLCPFASSIYNDLGPYDGFLAMLTLCAIWGLPYLIGRIYFNSLEGLRQLAVGIFIGGLVYIPLCLYEIRMSPQLHRMFYGFYQGGFGQSLRYGGYRPMVFLQHGLMVGLWMMGAALIGIWLWHSKTIDNILGIPMGLLVVVQCAMVVMVKSTGAILLLVLGLSVMFLATWTRMAIVVWLLIMMVPSYLFFSASGELQPNAVVAFVAENINPERAQSLQFRFDNEVPLSAKAREQWLFGWGGWARAAIYNRWDGRQQSVSDSLWIIAFGSFGTVGLVSVMAALLFPSMGFLISYSATTWSNKRLAPAAALMIVLILYTLDNLLNDMKMPLYITGAGGITGLLTSEASKTQGMSLSVSENFLR